MIKLAAYYLYQIKQVAVAVDCINKSKIQYDVQNKQIYCNSRLVPTWSIWL